jgi:hypothetical protein
MTLSEADRKWRAERLQAVGTPRSRRVGGTRFAPVNAVRDGGWLAALTGQEAKVWFVLWSMADARNRVRASHGTIAARCGIRRNHAASTTRALERYGLVRVLVRGRTVGQAGKRTANEYELLVPEPCANSPAGRTIEEDE